MKEAVKFRERLRRFELRWPLRCAQCMDRLPGRLFSWNSPAAHSVPFPVTALQLPRERAGLADNPQALKPVSESRSKR